MLERFALNLTSIRGDIMVPWMGDLPRFIHPCDSINISCFVVTVCVAQFQTNKMAIFSIRFGCDMCTTRSVEA